MLVFLLVFLHRYTCPNTAAELRYLEIVYEF